MKDKVQARLNQKNEVIKKRAKDQVESSMKWLESHKKSFTSRTLTMGIVLLTLGMVLKSIKSVLPSFYKTFNIIEGYDLIEWSELTGWGVTLIGSVLFFCFYIYPTLKKILLFFWTPVFYVILFVLSIVFRILELLGVGAGFMKAVRHWVPQLRKRKNKQDEIKNKEDESSFEALKKQRVRKKQEKNSKKNIVIPGSVKLIEHGPTYYFDIKPEDKEKSKAIGDKVKDRFYFACQKYDLEGIRVEKVIKGPSATILCCNIGSMPLSTLTKRQEDITREMHVDGIRIENGHGLVNVIVPCRAEEREFVQYYEIIKDFKPSPKSPIEIPIGKLTTGEILTVDIAKQPHIGVAGQTQSGKSTMIQVLASSLLMRHGPETLRFLMIDTKMVELTCYNDIPHMIGSVVVDPDKAVEALTKVELLMRSRYKTFSDVGVKNIEQYNAKAKEAIPYIIVIIEELADLMMSSKLSETTEDLVTKFAQLGRAAGIHLIIATQRPTVKVMTGLIKANVPGRLVFTVSNSTDSIVALNEGGAEKLLGYGDGLYKTSGFKKPLQFQSGFIDETAVEGIVNHWKAYSPEKDIKSIDEEIRSDLEGAENKTKDKRNETASKKSRVKNNESAPHKKADEIKVKSGAEPQQEPDHTLKPKHPSKQKTRQNMNVMPQSMLSSISKTRQAAQISEVSSEKKDTKGGAKEGLNNECNDKSNNIYNHKSKDESELGLTNCDNLNQSHKDEVVATTSDHFGHAKPNETSQTECKVNNELEPTGQAEYKANCIEIEPSRRKAIASQEDNLIRRDKSLDEKQKANPKEDTIENPEILKIYSNLDEQTLRVGVFVAAVRFKNKFTSEPILPSTRNINDILKMKKERLLKSMTLLHEKKVIQKSEKKGRNSETKILITYEDAEEILRVYKPEILKT